MLDKDRPILERSDRYLSFSQKIIRLLFTKKKKDCFHWEGSPVEREIKHRVISPVRAAVVIALIGIAVVTGVKSDKGDTKEAPKGNLPVPAKVVPENPSVANEEPKKTQMFLNREDSNAEHPNMDTLWGVVRKYLIVNDLPADNATIDAIIDECLAQQNVDPTSLPHGQAIDVTHYSGGQIVVRVAGRGVVVQED